MTCRPSLPAPARPARAVTRPLSRLARVRRHRKLTQTELAARAGISERHLRDLERTDELRRQPLWLLVSLCIALRCQLGDIVEPGWLTWTAIAADAPPDAAGHEIQAPQTDFGRTGPGGEAEALLDQERRREAEQRGARPR
jgi:DNA-binding Xre family transcriptional regulator